MTDTTPEHLYTDHASPDPSHRTDAVCECTRRHSPPVLEGNWHHVRPRGMGGGNIPENVIFICPTTHTNAHEILRELVRANAPLPRRRAWPQYAYNVALTGFTRWKENTHGNPLPPDSPLSLPLPDPVTGASAPPGHENLVGDD